MLNHKQLNKILLLNHYFFKLNFILLFLCSKVSPNEKNKGKRKYKQKASLKKKSIKNKKLKNLKKPKRQRRSKINDDEAQIANNIAFNYNICHHCKQRKPIEVLTKCKTNDCGKVEAPSKHLVINNTTVFRSNFII